MIRAGLHLWGAELYPKRGTRAVVIDDFDRTGAQAESFGDL